LRLLAGRPQGGVPQVQARAPPRVEPFHEKTGPARQRFLWSLHLQLEQDPQEQPSAVWRGSTQAWPQQCPPPPLRERVSPITSFNGSGALGMASPRGVEPLLPA